MGEWLLRELQLEAAGRIAQRRGLLHLGGGKGDHRELAAALEHDVPAFVLGLPATHTRGSGRGSRVGAPTNAELTAYIGCYSRCVRQSVSI
jgi:hypothetical protein